MLLLQQITPSPAHASYAAATFWGAITLGRLAAVGLAALLTPPRLLLGQMCLLSLGAVLLSTALPSRSLPAANAAGAVFGLGMSSVFPTMLSLPGALGYKLDVQATSHFLVASCLGEALLPVGMGEVMHVFETSAFPGCVLVGVAGMWALVAALLLPLWLPGLGGGRERVQKGWAEGLEMAGKESAAGAGSGVAAM